MDQTKLRQYGLHHELLRLAGLEGIKLEPGAGIAGLTTRGHAIEEGRYDIPAGVLQTLREIFESLGGDAKQLACRKSFYLSPDLFHPASGTLIEVDEVQHFTSARLATLRLYPESCALGFDLEDYAALATQWSEKADRAFADKDAAEFPGSNGRQRQRAYFDSVRDLLAPYLTGHTLIRIAAPDRSLEHAVKILAERLLPV